MTGSPDVEEYLEGLPPQHRAVVEQVRTVLRSRMPAGYDEGFAFNMIWYSIPLARFPETYNGKPLGFAAIAVQKNHFSLHLMAFYGEKNGHPAVKKIFDDAGLKLDMGKACIRFKKVADLPLEQIGDLIATVPPDQFIRQYEAVRAQLPKPAPRAERK